MKQPTRRWVRKGVGYDLGVEGQTCIWLIWGNHPEHRYMCEVMADYHSFGRSFTIAAFGLTPDIAEAFALAKYRHWLDTGKVVPDLREVIW